MRLRVFLSIFLMMILAACSSTKTVVSDEVVFFGEGKYWDVKYTFNPELYKEKKISWVEMEAKDLELSKLDLDQLVVELESRDGTVSGKVGDMEVKIEGKVLSFVVGTVNTDTFLEDEYKLKINYEDQQDVIKLKVE
ncbi:hypothetical protein SM124_13910 [Bacillus sp. 31A1R]|uniref:Lipoprotein n=1 Tax=Robertmurraya mangrovi TaxID=3098077 RepID=A0ABU5J084_9BACI|nr:hypothetical protein [Bacillus sp. 31A1R]MDZ5472823.1 hypothetical protein [Bacillus sp. 31A1R]